MIIDLDRIREEGDRYIGSEPKEAMDLARDPDIEVKDGLRYDLAVQRIDDTVDVRGTLELEVTFRCSRCAEFYDDVVRETAFETLATPVGNSGSIDLTEELREAILLAFPTFPVCSPACKGLCSQCGANLNRETCNCRPPEQDPWHGLSDLNTT